MVPVHYRVEADRINGIAAAQGLAAGHGGRGDGQARVPRHSAVTEPDHRRQDHCPGAHCRCTAGGTETRRRRLRRADARRPAASTASPARPTSSCPRSTASTSTASARASSARQGTGRHDQRPAAQEDPDGAREGHDRRPGHRPQARYRRRAGAEASARNRRTAPEFAHPGQPTVRLAQRGLRRQFPLPPRPRPPVAAAHRRGALDPRADRPACRAIPRP